MCMIPAGIVASWARWQLVDEGKGHLQWPTRSIGGVRIVKVNFLPGGRVRYAILQK